MSTGRNWKEFIDAWRGNDLAERFGGWLWHAARLLSWPLRHPHRTVKEIEPWGILFAVLGLFLSLGAFALDYREKVEERTVRAWQLLTTKAPGNSGKIQALEYLAKRDGFWCDEGDCLITLKTSTPLIGIDLSTEDGKTASYLSGANLFHANLQWASLQRANLVGADLSGAKLSKANLFGED